MFKKIITFKLKIAAKILLARKKPEIIAVTGSAGKTSAKELMRAILATEFEVLASPEGYNTEIGAPLVLFNEKVPEKINSVFAWSKILLRCYAKAFFDRHFAEKVIIEMGADAPGDIDYLTKLFRPQKGVILTVLPVHLASFKNIETVANEKSKLAQNVRRGGRVYLNLDDPRVAEMKANPKAQVFTFGTKAGADLRAKNIKTDLSGMTFDLYEGEHKESLAVRLYGEQMIYPLLAAIAVARGDHISYKRIKQALKEVKPFRGRMNIIEGKNDSIIIDDSYNANPRSVIRALDFLGKQKGRRIALLGNMNELGTVEKEGHEQVGDAAAKSADLLVTVGSVAGKYIVAGAKRAGMTSAQIKSFDTAPEAGKHLSKIIRKGDVILAKGSQNKVRLEQAIELFMAHPDEKDKILVRQSRFWRYQE